MRRKQSERKGVHSWDIGGKSVGRRKVREFRIKVWSKLVEENP